MQIDSGIYVLIIQLKKNTRLKIGKLGTFNFKKGYYLYVGSALKNLSKRLERHKKKKNKNLYWHIDFFLNDMNTEIKDIKIFSPEVFNECELTKKIISIPGAKIKVKSFGASDCKKGCKSHFIFFKEYSANVKEFFSNLNCNFQ
ncbi:GIY-YIG nuclease family protein [candidate division KSB1 bacterium]|nr:MAG: GIY-YIG nuclease family protein [candidate division KSB1 bacterium]